MPRHRVAEGQWQIAVLQQCHAGPSAALYPTAAAADDGNLIVMDRPSAAPCRWCRCRVISVEEGGPEGPHSHAGPSSAPGPSAAAAADTDDDDDLVMMDGPSAGAAIEADDDLVIVDEVKPPLAAAFNDKGKRPADVDADSPRKRQRGS